MEDYHARLAVLASTWPSFTEAQRQHLAQAWVLNVLCVWGMRFAFARFVPWFRGWSYSAWVGHSQLEERLRALLAVVASTWQILLEALRVLHVPMWVPMPVIPYHTSIGSDTVNGCSCCACLEIWLQTCAIDHGDEELSHNVILICGGVSAV